MNKAIEGNMDIIKSAARLKTSANKVYKQKLTFLPLNDTPSMLQFFYRCMFLPRNVSN